MIIAKSILNKLLDLILKPSRLKIMLDNLPASDLVLHKVTQKLEKVGQEEVSVIYNKNKSVHRFAERGKLLVKERQKA